MDKNAIVKALIGLARVAVAPPGWEGTVKKMKKHPEIDNPWALAWWQKGEGHEPHKAEDQPQMRRARLTRKAEDRKTEYIALTRKGDRGSWNVLVSVTDKTHAVNAMEHFVDLHPGYSGVVQEVKALDTGNLDKRMVDLGANKTNGDFRKLPGKTVSEKAASERRARLTRRASGKIDIAKELINLAKVMIG